MTNFPLSRFETYLLDEEIVVDSSAETQETTESILLEREEFPSGFFSSL